MFFVPIFHENDEIALCFVRLHMTFRRTPDASGVITSRLNILYAYCELNLRSNSKIVASIEHGKRENDQIETIVVELIGVQIACELQRNKKD